MSGAPNCNYWSLHLRAFWMQRKMNVRLFFELDDTIICPFLHRFRKTAEKYIAVGFDYSLLNDFLNTLEKKEDLS